MTKNITIIDQVAFWRMKFSATMGQSTRSIPMVARSDLMFDKKLEEIQENIWEDERIKCDPNQPRVNKIIKFVENFNLMYLKRISRCFWKIHHIKQFEDHWAKEWDHFERKNTV